MVFNQIRMMLDLDVAEIADEIGVTYISLGRFLKGEKTLENEQLEKLSNFFAVKLYNMYSRN